ncbi:GerMN domain-containing protein [Paenibacillus spiritus]|uniref:GerMN domain-containing protein n=1 Tax=Paenibacillus spiritus TaxID=2496557 RepID=A0A5J5GDY9_9BACL|nr:MULTISPECIES: GerMN domain-containing protein [Paenibacillus]KAA9006291.1 GerMN domain-containing protein [Paenibacillus spiritus]
MMKKVLPIAAAGMTLAVLLAGCGSKPAAAPSAASASPAVQAEGSAASPAPSATAAPSPSASASAAAEATQAPAATSSSPADTEEKQSREINVYYTDAEQMDLVPAKAKISFKDEAADKYREAFRALQTSDNPDLVPLWERIELKSVTFTNGLLTLDIHKPQEAQLGAGGESFAIQALTSTMFQFTEVQNIEVLVDGEQTESLMGHVDLLYPFTRANSAPSQE